MNEKNLCGDCRNCDDGKSELHYPCPLEQRNRIVVEKSVAEVIAEEEEKIKKMWLWFFVKVVAGLVAVGFGVWWLCKLIR